MLTHHGWIHSNFSGSPIWIGPPRSSEDKALQDTADKLRQRPEWGECSCSAETSTNYDAADDAISVEEWPEI